MTPICFFGAEVCYLLSRGIRQHRSRLKIINDILSVARHGERKTHIMYRANLSYDQLNEYLTFLLENKLIEKEADQEYEGALIYKATSKGRQFLERYAQLQEIISHPASAQKAGADYLDLTIIGE